MRGTPIMPSLGNRRSCFVNGLTPEPVDLEPFRLDIEQIAQRPGQAGQDSYSRDSYITSTVGLGLKMVGCQWLVLIKIFWRSLQQTA